MPVFVSYAEKDSDSVGLLVRLFNFHGIPTWHARGNLGPGKFTDAIQKQLALAEMLVVSLSRNAVKSQWVRREVHTFLAAKQGKQVVPVLFDNTEPSALTQDLEEYQCFRFSSDGMEKLFRFLGKEFLQPERRRTGDRRKEPVERRLQRGLWIAYHRATQAEKREPFLLNLVTLRKVREILQEEVHKYSYTNLDTGEPANPNQVLIDATSEVWHLARGLKLNTVNTIEEIGEQIARRYKVKAIDRRGL